MVNTLDTLGKPAGGSVAYVSGKEVFRDLSGANFDCQAQSSPIVDIGKTVVLYSSVDNSSYKLPNANATGMAVGKGTGFIVLPHSKPIRLLNQGTAGTDPVLEAFMMPGSSGKIFAASVATAVGDWRKGASSGWFHGAVAVKLANLDAGTDLGAVRTGGGEWDNNVFMQNGGSIARLSDTLYVFVYQTATTAIKAQAASYVHATDIWTYGTAVTAFTSANVWTTAGIIALSATQYAIAAWEATAATAGVRGGTVAGTTITQGTAITSGAWGINPSSIKVANSCALVADSASTFFWAGKYDGTHLGVMHFSIVGANVTQDGGSAFASSAPADSKRMFGYSPSANNLDLGISSTNGNHIMARYTYSAGSVTAVNIPLLSRTLHAGATGALWPGDTTNKSYFVENIAQTYMMRLTLNAGATAVTETAQFSYPTVGTLGAATAGMLAFLGDNEGIYFAANQNSYQFVTLFDPQMALRARDQVAAGTSSDSGIMEHSIPAAAGFLSQSTLQLKNMDIHKATRRCVVAGDGYDSAGAADFRRWRMCMFDLPRNYDASMGA